MRAQHTSVTAAGASARYDLDSYMASPIFTFAAEQIRRRVVWGDCRDDEDEDESEDDDMDDNDVYYFLPL